jgi:hypothetical protein
MTHPPAGPSSPPPPPGPKDQLEAYIARVAAAAPLLTDELITRLRDLLQPVTDQSQVR